MLPVALPGVIPVARRRQRDRNLVPGQLVDELRQLEDRGLCPAGEVEDLARLAPDRAGEQPADDVVHVDEVAGGDAAVLDRQGLPPSAL